jgi:hypothetical protein
MTEQQPGRPGDGPDPADVEPTDNSSGAAPDLGRVEEADREAAEVERRLEDRGAAGRSTA